MKNEELVERIAREVLQRLRQESEPTGGGSEQVCLTCIACGECVTRRPEAVAALVNAGASRVSSTAGAAPRDETIASLIDHTLLKPDATREDIAKLCDEAVRHGFAAVCVQPCHVRLVAERLDKAGVKTRACTVVGFPQGANRSDVKAVEARKAVGDGAREIDMVMNVGVLKSGDYRYVESDIRGVVEACGRGVVTKVILETGYLSDEEKIKACALAKAAGVDYVKTSTGFGPRGASVEDVQLMRKVVGEDVGVKAAGGIRTAADLRKMVEAGATRIGTSASIKIIGSA
ncbi:MAG: deoxyribose-phosphate aldolase [Candidatus Eiseniibacteriota bacterium]|nr:MAG: deoxyribose-phosphate aldolase [Candidatus Eisenbacteria bacterium]